MIFFVLSRNSRLYSTRRLVEAAQKRKHEVYVRDPLKFTLHVQDSPHVTYLSRPVMQPDVIIPRIGASITYFGCALVRQFEQMGVISVNSAHAITNARDKLKALQILSRHLPLPRTALVQRKREILKAIDAIGGGPVVIKVIEGTQGVGVVLARDRMSAHAIIELLQSARQNILIQEFIEDSSGRDIRAFVIGGKVVAAMRRISSDPLEFRANVHRGAKAEPVTLSKEYEKVAIQASEMVGLNVAGVDLLESERGPLVIEVNSSPGLEAIERTTGVDIASEIVSFAEKQGKR